MVRRPPCSRKFIDSQYDAVTSAAKIRSTFDVRYRMLVFGEQTRRDMVAGSVWGRFFEALPMPQNAGDFDAVFCLRCVGLIKESTGNRSRISLLVTPSPLVTVGIPGIALIAAASGVVAAIQLSLWVAAIGAVGCLLVVALVVSCAVSNEWIAEERILDLWIAVLREELGRESRP
jgi:lysylphosphatidylglycerol synthetase-like protein (DUF2156 family)